MKKYNQPYAEIIEFKVQDVMLASGKEFGQEIDDNFWN